MRLTEQLIELIESKAIEEGNITVTSWFVLDAIPNIVTWSNSELGRFLNPLFLEEPQKNSRTVREFRTDT